SGEPTCADMRLRQTTSGTTTMAVTRYSATPGDGKRRSGPPSHRGGQGFKSPQLHKVFPGHRLGARARLSARESTGEPPYPMAWLIAPIIRLWAPLRLAVPWHSSGARWAGALRQDLRLGGA